MWLFEPRTLGRNLSTFCILQSAVVVVFSFVSQISELVLTTFSKTFDRLSVL